MKTIVTTARLTLRQAKLSDKHLIYELLNSPKWLKYIGIKNIKTLNDAENYIKDRLFTSYKTNGYGLYIIHFSKSLTPIGLCGYVNRDYLDYPDIGFALLEKYERKGYTFEAASALLQYGKNHLNFTHVLAITKKGNFASQNLLQKLDFNFISYINEPVNNEEICLFKKNL